MRNLAKKMKGKKVLSLLLAMVMMLSVASPAFSPVMGIIAKAADGDTVELAFNNIFVLEAWANNSLSSKVIVGGTPQDSGLEVDLQNGSFTLTKTVAEGNELYTAFSMSTTNAGQNTQYYMMDIEPNTTYTFSYNVTGNIYVFTPYVFFYDDEGLFIENGLVAYSTPGYGYNEFSFTTPAKAESMQLRWTIGDNSTTGNTTATTVTATVTDVAIFETEIKNQYLSSKNIFKIEEWASNTNSSTTPSSDLGTVTPNVSDGSISFVNSGTGYLWTGFGIDQENSNDAYYTMTVSPSTSYTLTYDLTDQNLLGPIYCQPFIVEMDSDGKCITYYPNQTASLSNKFQFTTQSTTARIQLVFALITDADNTASADSPRYVTVSNIGIYETSVFNADFETFAGYPHRLAYTEGAGTYGTLPTPTNIPAGKHFAGWYTGKDGSGEAITADTEISYKSFTVYPYYQAKVDSISVKTLPSKTTYTLGEKLNPAGLVLTATQTYTVDVTDADGNPTGETETKTSTFDITSGYTIEPENLTATGTQTITVSYGGQTTTFTVTVNEYEEKTISVNSADLVARVANNVYTLDYTAPEAFSRYELTYYSDSYVKGTITMADGTYEEFFLEPSTKGSFASYIDDFLTGGTYADIRSIGFECLDKEFGNFELYSVDTIYVEKPADTMAYYENSSYKAGINLAWGGVLAYLQDYENAPVAATYSDGITKVNYSSQLPSGSTSQSNTVNLINTYDKGRYVQQSYYGTREEPYVLGDYNGVEWNYNPVQGGNILGESSKVVDYRITDTEIYVKTRPLEWAKWSDEAGQKYNDEQPDDSLDKELIYEDSYNAWAYMESWYVFEDGMLKTYCRYVDYSGYPSATTTQEFPAFYCVEPLNNFVYYAGGEAWDDATNTVQWASDLDFWGASTEYNEMLIANGLEAVDPYFNCNENWAAFMGGATNADYGIGIYTADVTDFVAGSFQTKYQEDQTTLIEQETSLRHADTTDPATENPTSYISPIDTMELESYKEYTYSYYITTGTQEEIREDFRMAKAKDEAEAAEGTRIAVPETVYMQPVNTPDATTTAGQYYVNNVLDTNNYYSIETVANAADNMYFGIYSSNAKQYKISVTNVTNASDDIILGNADGTGNVEGTWYTVGETGHDIRDEVFSMRFASTGLKSGEIATAKWEITVEYEDGTTKTHTAYTVLYAPELTVGAVAESRYDSAANNEISSWITGANGVDHSQRAPLGSFHGDYHDSGYFIYDPLAYPTLQIPAGAGSQSQNDFILGYDSSSTNDDYSDTAYVLQTATNGSDGSRSQSYLGLLTVDKSRYTNTEQIPNLKMGYDVLRLGTDETDSLASYTTYYTLGTADSYTSTSLSEAPSGWTVDFTGTEVAKDIANFTDRRTVVPSYAVSDIDGKYIHAVNQAMSESMSYSGVITINTFKRYATAGTSLLCSVTDKSGLRDSVLEGYNVSKDDYSEDSYNKMVEKLQPAATVLGDPSATQEEIDNAQKELDETLDGLTNIFYALKYDNLFSAYEFSQKTGSMKMNVSSNASISYNSGKLTVISDNAEKSDIYATEGHDTTLCYNVSVNPSTEYVFEYDVTTVAGSQMLLFFYDANGNQVASTNQTMQIGSGNPSTITSSPHFAAYVTTNGHVVLKFTTNANVDRIGFRFGNTNNVVNTSTFSNMRLIDSAHYYEDATYSATEAVYKEHASYGTLATVTRPGYTFTGWKDTAGNTVTGADIATEHKSIYSQWTEHTYTIVYNANGGAGAVSSQTQKYSANATLASSGFTRTGYTLIGWSTDGNATTAQYSLGQSVSKLSAEDGGQVTLYAVWELDSYVSDDTVIIDFGLPVKISVLANDIAASNGTINGIGTGVQSGTVLNTDGYTSTRLTGKAATLSLGNGTAKVEDDKIVYTPASTNYEAEEVFYYEFKTTDNKFYYAVVTVIPATSIYFEETMFTFTDSVVTVDGVEKEYKWQDVGTSVGERFQSDDRPGSFTIDDADAVYGTDSAYNDSTTYSMGSAKFITVDGNANKANPLATASFTFTGTGFDLFTVTDSKAGLLTVSIYDENGTKVKGLAVNTYYGYTYDSESGEYITSNDSDSALFQVPAIRARNLDYDTYTVKVEPKYTYPFDVNNNKQYRVYVDSVRIYDPMGTDNDIANDAYLADGEYAPDYLRLRDTIVTKDENGDYNVSTYENSSLFFEGYSSNWNDVSEVIKSGPKNEVYIAKGQAVAFNISATSALNLASVQLGMKLIDANGNAEVTVMNTNDKQPTEITLTSTTEQYYKLDSAIVWDDTQAEGTFKTKYPIVILNSSDNDVVVSLTNLKWAFEDAGAGISTFSIIGDEQTLAFAPAAIEYALTRVDPIDPENVAIDSPETVYLEDGKGEFTITTEAEIEKVTVNGVELTDCEINEDGKKVWTYSFDAEDAGENVFEILVYDDEGNQSETITNTINVVAEDDNDGDLGFSFNDTFVNNLLEGIFNLLRKIFELIGGSLA